MNQKKTIFFAAAILVASFVAAPNAKAGDAAPGEGFYAGAFFGHGTGVVTPKIEVFDIDNGGKQGNDSATFEADRGGFGLSGIQGGGWLGWGMKTADDIYVGAELSFAGSDEKIKLKSTVDLTDGETSEAITSATASRDWVAGSALRVGYYVNNETLLAFSGGIAVSSFDVSIGSDSDTFYAGGPQFGASITTNLKKLDPNLGLRMEVVYTDYLTAEINGIDGANVNGSGTSGKNNNSELTGSDTAGRIGITYRF